MWNFLLNLQSVCDSRKTDETLCFFAFARKPTARKKSLCGCRRCLHGQICNSIQDRLENLPNFSFQKKRVNFSIELSLVQYIQVILNLPFKFYETLVEVNLRLWECERWDVVKDCGREKRWAAHKEISSVSQKWIQNRKKHRCHNFDNAA